MDWFFIDEEGFPAGLATPEDEGAVLGWDSNEKPLYKPKYSFEEGTWVEGMDLAVLLEDEKEHKEVELSLACKEAIFYGFKHVIDGVEFRFSYDAEAQVNFQETYRLFQDNVIKEVNWTAHSLDDTEKRVRVTLNKTLFLGLYYESVKHKLNTISYLRDVLNPLLDKAETVEEVNSIYWKSPLEDSISPLSLNDTLEKRIDKTALSQAQADAELLNLFLLGAV